MQRLRFFDSLGHAEPEDESKQPLLVEVAVELEDKSKLKEDDEFTDCPEAPHPKIKFPANRTKLALGDELFECIKCLENARDKKLDAANHILFYKSRTRGILIALSTLTSLGAGLFVGVGIHQAKQHLAQMKDELSRFLPLLSNLAAEAEQWLATANATLGITNLTKNLGNRFRFQSEFWQKNESIDSLGVHPGCSIKGNISGKQLKYDYKGHCTEWILTNGADDQYQSISKDYPEFDGTNFCALKDNFFHCISTCNEMVRSICGLDTEIAAANTSAFQGLVHSTLTAQYVVSELELKMNQEKAAMENIHVIDAAHNIAAGVGAVIFTYLIMYLATNLYAYKKARAKADDSYLCLQDEDPTMINRIITLCARFNFSLKDLKTSELIEKLKKEHTDLLSRRHQRLKLFYFFMKASEEAVPGKREGFFDAAQHLLGLEGISARQQTPRPK